jgi:hypothetical protein
VNDQADDDRRTAMLLMAERLAELECLAANRWLPFTDDELVVPNPSAQTSLEWGCARCGLRGSSIGEPPREDAS